MSFDIPALTHNTGRFTPCGAKGRPFMEPQALSTLENILHTQGLAAGLQFLNDRVAHRFTGIYRVDGQVLPPFVTPA